MFNVTHIYIYIYIYLYLKVEQNIIINVINNSFVYNLKFVQIERLD